MNIDAIMNPSTPSASQKKAAIAIVLAVSEAIRELGSVPSGTLYANLCGKIDLPTYERIIGTLKNAGLVNESAHMLTWTGPELRS